MQYINKLVKEAASQPLQRSMLQLQVRPTATPDLLSQLRSTAPNFARLQCVGTRDWLLRAPAKRKRLYTTGELNRLIDDLLHPLAKLNPEILILDGILHSLLEQNPTESVQKFIQYNVPKLLAEFRKRKR